MKKQIKKIGNSYVISFTREERKIYGLEEGIVIDIDDLVVYEKGKQNGHY